MAATLDGASGRLAAAGFGARSAYLTSTSGGGSWLAHTTLLSGSGWTTCASTPSLTTSDRLTVVRAFPDAGWRTVAVMPGNHR